MSATADATPVAIAEFKQRSRAVWAAGDYPSVARHLADVGRGIVRLLDIRPGEEVLDVACGAGNATIPAARAGASVTGVDLTPELLDAARESAAEAGVRVRWEEGDAEALPVEDESVDVVLSTFGCMFSPRHEVAARELTRVLRPGGRLGLCNWTPEGSIGGFFAVVGGHLPPLPEYASPPPLWGSADHVRQLFDGTGIQLEFEPDVVELRFGSVPEIFDYYTTHFGPLITARGLLEPQGKWPALRDDLHAYFEDNTVDRDGGVVWPGEYLVVLGRKSSR
jgi:SAM-dependent methyltransferase